MGLFFPLISCIFLFHQEPLLQHSQVQPGQSCTHFHHPLLIMLVLSLGTRLASFALWKGFLGGLWQSEPQPALKPDLLTSAAKRIHNNKALLFISSKDIKSSCSACTCSLLCRFCQLNKNPGHSFFLSHTYFSQTLSCNISFL